MFPLSTGGYAGEFQDIMHMVTTGIVVLLSIDGYYHCGSERQALPFLRGVRRSRAWNDACRCSGMKIVPAAYFGVVERFSVFAATGFNAALGIHLFCSKP